MSNDIANINVTKRMLTSKFDMKDLGVADLILGIKIHKTPQGLRLSQSHYIKTILEKFKFLDFKVAKTPINVNLALAKNKGQSISKIDYAHVLGCLINYLAVIEGYCDANWITGSADSKSTSGYVFTIGGGAGHCPILEKEKSSDGYKYIIALLLALKELRRRQASRRRRRRMARLRLRLLLQSNDLID
ncbi:uncharacterized mitochondrial protein AtMg00810-like [Nicotiana tomentosiformis]|uniref:uncharacterized mitochondrial protein AtMg00810-like n=1 Tax=Nicotiana tomentosiformis TaxID=4098 RepID=UPI00388C9559